MRLQQHPDDPALREAWRAWLAAHAGHGAAWQRVERLQTLLTQVPSAGSAGLRRAPVRRRRALLGLLVGSAAASSAWWLWHTEGGEPLAEWVETAPGERRELALAGAGRVLLAPGSRLGWRRTAQGHELELLRGQLQFDSEQRAKTHTLTVRTAEAWVRPLGTRFTVERSPGSARTTVAVQEARVLAAAADNPSGQAVHAGQRLLLGPGGRQQLEQAGPADDAWVRGLVLALDQPLAQLLAQLQNHSGVPLACDPELAGQRVSGSYPIAPVADTLRLLAELHGWQVQAEAGGWRLRR